MSSFFLPIRTKGKDRKRGRQKEDRKVSNQHYSCMCDCPRLSYTAFSLSDSPRGKSLNSRGMVVLAELNATRRTSLSTKRLKAHSEQEDRSVSSRENWPQVLVWKESNGTWGRLYEFCEHKSSGESMTCSINPLTHAWSSTHSLTHSPSHTQELTNSYAHYTLSLLILTHKLTISYTLTHWLSLLTHTHTQTHSHSLSLTHSQQYPVGTSWVGTSTSVWFIRWIILYHINHR